MAKYNPPVSISIIVCTYNRADSLVSTLQALVNLRVPPGLEWEVIVVDNNSHDDTSEIVRSKQASFPQLRYLFEQRQGLSHARNSGIAAARGELLLFTDDDVQPEPDWVVEVLQGMEKYDATACGGYIAPLWDSPPPSWLTERLYGFLAIKTDERERRILKESEFPFGANMAFRREVFSRFGVFDPDLGRKGSVLAGCEEFDLIGRLIASSEVVVYLPDARVHHRVEAFRTRKSYFRKWRLHNSRNLAETYGLPGDRKLLGIPLYLFGQFWRAIRTALYARIKLPADEALLKELVVWHFLGTVQGLWLARNANRNPLK
ncbi:glycosyltransferase [Methylococcus sp. EFPC2]|uniref:glycosyltransferase n=1 Tax=Methylococcus sp. EFPC2 TaxID=2812648 RepID=UPI0019673DC7|nr:glycosyltransferase [Methylococcus sp. EFPC2]QSA98439.1 glycosyltransferase family 2 protein [Methylococcus sp. EFPC2]